MSLDTRQGACAFPAGLTRASFPLQSSKIEPLGEGAHLLDLMKPPCDEAVIGSRNGLRLASGKQATWVLAATILGSSMAFIDSTVVNVALPALQKSFGASVIGVQWVVEAYGLTLSALILVGGSMGDMFGRRRMFVLGVGIFAAASVYCGLAPSIGQLIAARAVQGYWRRISRAREPGAHQRVL